MKYLLVLFFSIIFLGSFLVARDVAAVTAWCKKGDLCQPWILYQKCEDGWQYIANAGESPCDKEQTPAATGETLDCSACNALATPESVDSCLQSCEAGGGSMPAGQPGAPSAGTSVGNFGSIGTKLGNVSKGFYGDVAPKSLEQMIGGYIKTGLALVGVIFLLLMVYGGYTWMIARGDETEATKAKDTITMAAIGMAVVLIAYAVTYLIVSRFTALII